MKKFAIGIGLVFVIPLVYFSTVEVEAVKFPFFQDSLFRTLTTASLRQKSEAELREFFPRFESRVVNVPNDFKYPVIEEDHPIDTVVSLKLPDGYQRKSYRIIIGSGKDLYTQASSNILHGRWPQSISWAKTVSQTSDNLIGSLIITHARCLGIWSVNPCRITTKIVSNERDKELILSYRTVDGHLLQGEESYRLLYRKATNEVELQIVSCARINSLFQPLLTPFIRPLQDQFLKESALAFCNNR